MGQQVISVEEAPDRYPDQWVLMQITEYRLHAPVAGVILAAGLDEHVQAVLMDHIHAGCPDPPYYRFFAFKYKHLDPEWCEAWDQIMTEAMIEELALDDERG